MEKNYIESGCQAPEEELEKVTGGVGSASSIWVEKISGGIVYADTDALKKESTAVIFEGDAAVHGTIGMCGPTSSE